MPGAPRAWSGRAVTHSPDDDQLAFPFPTTDTTPPDNPLCRSCNEPVPWMPRAQPPRWGTHCGGNACRNPQRICRNCGQAYNRAEGGTRYCSPACSAQWHNGSHRSESTPNRKPSCAWCGTIPFGPPRQVQGAYVCAPCLEPVAKVIGRLRKHRTPLDMVRRLAADPVCDICRTDIVTPRLNTDGHWRSPLTVDHDHACCPSTYSCGECVRGFLCDHCNLMIGNARENPATLELAAAYLRSGRP